jgi:methenyltetrahydrofolate cyclohydrolase
MSARELVMDEEDVLGSDNSVQEWSDAVAETTSTPAGGAVAALATALAASLVAMVAGLTIKREKYAAVHDHARDTLQRAEQLRNDLLDIATLDAVAVAEYMDALSLPQGTEFERTAREAAKRAALMEAARIQLELLHQASEVAELAEAMVGSGLATAIGDAASAGLLAAATSRSAYWSIRSNMKAARWPEEGRLMMDSAWITLEHVEAAELRVQQLLEERVG